ncbi:MAG: LysR family transcriptional regulator [Peptococcaceae bacterium]|nr:LysR family transcriptional regulator [Peptococcaceae bacterium]
MKLEQLHQIIEIERYQSISKAAKALFMAQSSLSGSLNSLEAEIGVRLFERTSSGVTATPEGQEIIQIARGILDGCGLILSFGEKNHQLRGDVNLYIAQAFGFMFSEILVAFKTRFPKANLNLRIMTADQIVDQLAQGNGNLGLIMWEFLPEQTQDALKRADLDFETFHKRAMMLYVSQDNPLADNEDVRLKDLRKETFISYSSSYWAKINSQIQSDEEPLVMTDREALKRMISTDEGIAVLPETFALHDLYCEQGMIKLIPIKGSESFGSAVEYLLYPTKRRLTLLEQKTLELLRDILTAE